MSTARILDISPDAYHELPQFNVSTAKVLLDYSPLHAKLRHAKKPTKEIDLGNVAHTLVLGKGKRFEVLDFEDYKTKAAREARDAVRKEGKVPVLGPDFDRAHALAEKLTSQLTALDIKLDGQSEVVVTWTEDTLWGPLECRAMLDHVWLDRGVIFDLKTTSNAAPHAVERTSESLHYAMQAHAYRRALEALQPDLRGKTDFLFAFAETDEPYAVNIARPDGSFRELGERRWQRALLTWAECSKDNHWPAYGTGVNPLRAPEWALKKEEFAA
jgi:hypothetical protein